jgi:hypothetical protein
VLVPTVMAAPRIREHDPAFFLSLGFAALVL